MKTLSILQSTFTRTAMTLFMVLLFVAGSKAQNDTPLTFEAIEAGTVTLEKVGDFTPNSGVQYRMGETGAWLSYSYGTGISLQAGEKLQFSSTSSDTYAIDGNKYSHFTCTADCYLYGNVCALFNNSNSMPDHACYKLFSSNTYIKNHAEKSLALPAISLGEECYQEMFSGCSSLTTAPELPATSLAYRCYKGMFRSCTSLTIAPDLPATILAPACYQEMFYGCTALKEAPDLFATSLVHSCYKFMFYQCYKLNYLICLATDIMAEDCTTDWLRGVASQGIFVKDPTFENWPTGSSGIPVGWTVEESFYFNTSLIFEALEEGTVTLEKVGNFTPNNRIKYKLGATGTWKSYSYGTSIHLQPGEKLGFCSTRPFAYAIDDEHYSHFTCTADCYLYGNVSALFFNTDRLPDHACSRLFYGNTHIMNPPDGSLALPAATLSNGCYQEMFSGCTSLTTAPRLPVTLLADSCYFGMFKGCSALTAAPELPATTLSNGCYQEMFSGCTTLTTAPELLATLLAEGCYYGMFSGCTNMNYMKCLATDISSEDCTTEWLDGVASTGTFVKDIAMTGWSSGDSGIPQGWTIVDYEINNYPLTFQAVESGTITVNLDEGSTLDSIQYKLNHNGWTNVAWNTPISLAANDVIRFRGNNGTCYDETNHAGFRFVCSNNCYVYGNLMSLINRDDFATYTTLNQSRAFYRIFQTSEPNITLLNHPSLDIVLPATTLTDYCYCGLFGNCQGITRAPALPATTLQEGCYFEMFYECTALIAAPALPATTLAEKCYYNMFSGCTSLATAPSLPATTIANECYYNMFSRCTNLTTAPELPATELYDRCYSGMFQGCTSLTTTPALPATALASNCYYSMFSGCTKLTVAPELPAGSLTQYCYHGMFKGCISLTTAPALPATTLADYCYDGMFQDCTGLTTALALPATTLANHCYEGMFNGCTALTTAPALPATSLSDYCYYEMFRCCTALTTAPVLPAPTLSDYGYQKMFYKCSNLNYVVCLATEIPASNCVKNWLEQVASFGIFVKAPNMSGWTTNSPNGIPSGWTVNTMDDVFTTDGNWDVAANWSNNAVPTTGSSVIIAAQATIPSGYVADAKCILVNEGNTLTIADGGQLIHDNAVTATLQKGITGFGNDNSVETGWYTIASPVAGNLNTSDVENLIASTATNYDLYLYNEPTQYWWNAKGSAHPFSTLQNGKGYLYANSADQTLSFTGVMRATNATDTVPLSYTTAAGGLKGFNLIGNPFTCNVTNGNVTMGGEALTVYYIVDGGGELSATALSKRPIKPGEGFFVQATAANQQLVFNPTTARGVTSDIPAFICIEAGNDRFMDRAYVQIGQGNTLRKMSLNDDTPKVYVMHDGNDYAAATIEVAEGEMPIHFKASQNGIYTLTVSESLNSKFSILNLIDNLTGNSVDLLATPSYTFEAKTTDYASRFKLVFNADGNGNADDEAFAFLSDGNIIINGEGTLQIIDVTGRVLFTREVCSSLLTPHSSLVPGVYVLRLINGEKVRTQKMVVE